MSSSVVRAQLHGAGLVTVDLDDDQPRDCARCRGWISAARAAHLAARADDRDRRAESRWRAGATPGWSMRAASCSLSDARFVPPELPQLSGPDGTEAEVTQRYLATQGRLTEVGLRLTALRARCARRLGASTSPTA